MGGPIFYLQTLFSNIFHRPILKGHFPLVASSFLLEMRGNGLNHFLKEEKYENPTQKYHVRH